MVEGHFARGPRHRTPLPAITIGDYLAAVAGRGPRCRAPVGDGDGAPYLRGACARCRACRLRHCWRSASRRATGSRSGTPDSTEWTLVQLAAARAGAVLVILDGDWDVRELGSALHETGARLLVAGSSRASRTAGAGTQRAGGARAGRGDCRGALRRPRRPHLERAARHRLGDRRGPAGRARGHAPPGRPGLHRIRAAGERQARGD